MSESDEVDFGPAHSGEPTKLELRIRALQEVRDQEKAAKAAEEEAFLARFRHPDGTVIGLEDWVEVEYERTEESTRKYYLKAVQGILEDMANADGMRNDMLNRCAYRLGRLSAGLGMPLEAMSVELAKVAMGTGLGRTETMRTLRSGLKKGIENPVQL